jgi:hypothetical protein
MIIHESPTKDQVQVVNSFQDLVSTSFHGEKNAACWQRELRGDFSEITHKLELKGNVTVIDEAQLLQLQLSEQGQFAREILLDDLQSLKTYGASPVLNLIKHYDRDHTNVFFPTDVYSFHVDRSPVPTHTFLCTYYGESSEILPNSQATQKVLIPEIRNELKKIYGGTEEGFESFLTDYFFDLHYLPQPMARSFSLGLGQLWKLAVDHPKSEALPCIHRAPEEKNGQYRLLMIC